MKKPKQTVTVFVGVDLQGDACLYLTVGESSYLTRKALDELAPRIEAFLNGERGTGTGDRNTISVSEKTND